jgi:hypothetical protein
MWRHVSLVMETVSTSKNVGQFTRDYKAQHPTRQGTKMKRIWTEIMYRIWQGVISESKKQIVKPLGCSKWCVTHDNIETKTLKCYKNAVVLYRLFHEVETTALIREMCAEASIQHLLGTDSLLRAKASIGFMVAKPTFPWKCYSRKYFMFLLNWKLSSCYL